MSGPRILGFGGRIVFESHDFDKGVEVFSVVGLDVVHEQFAVRSDEIEQDPLLRRLLTDK